MSAHTRPHPDSCVLLSLFIAFKFLPKALINMILSGYFAMLARSAHRAPRACPAAP